MQIGFGLALAVLVVLFDLTGAFEGSYYPLFLVIFAAFASHRDYFAYPLFIIIFGTFMFRNANDLGAAFVRDMPGLISFFVLTAYSGILGTKNRVAAKERETLMKGKLQGNVLLNSIADPFFFVNQNMKVSIINPAAEKLVSLDPGNIIGLSYSSVFILRDEREKPLSEDPVAHVLSKGETVRLSNITLITKTRTIYLSLLASPVKDASGKVIGAAIMLRDMTDHRAMEKLRDEFISIASHELRTPLFQMEGYLSLMLQKNPPEDIAKYAQKTRAIVTSSSNLIRNLLSAANIERGFMPKTTTTSVEIAPLIEECISFHKSIADSKGLFLRFEPAKGYEKGKKFLLPTLKIIATADQFKEILNNLIENALKFTNKGGVTVLASQGEKIVSICVQDTGVGISPEEQQKLFTKFYRADNEFTREVGGTGLGLYITKTLVEALGGQMRVESEIGKGSVFCFSLKRPE